MIEEGKPAPDFQATSDAGETVKLSELRKDRTRTKTGVVVLSFWC